MPTTGWRNPSLSEYVYIVPPKDGIIDFDFLAEPPTGIVLQVLTPIVAEYVWRGDFQDVDGVRIHASTNEKVALRLKDAPLLVGADLGTDHLLLRAMRGGGDALPW